MGTDNCVCFACELDCGQYKYTLYYSLCQYYICISINQVQWNMTPNLQISDITVCMDLSILYIYL